MSIDEVVVLPWVPATATVVRVAHDGAQRLGPAQHRDARAVRAATTSGLSSGIAVEITTASSASATLPAAWPTCAATPSEPERARAPRDSREVGAAHGWPMRDEHGGDRAHAGAADADDVDPRAVA